MAVIATEGFDTYNGIAAGNTTACGVLSRWVSTIPEASSLVPGRFGGQALRTSSQSGGIPTYILNLNQGCSSIATGFAFRLNSADNFVISKWRNLTTDQFSIGVNTINGNLYLNGPSGIIWTSNNGIVLPSVWYYFGIEAQVSTTANVNIYLNSPTALVNLTGVNTKNGSANTVDNYVIVGKNSTTGSPSADIDDIYVCNTNVWLGERRITTLYPSADITKNWSRSTGSNNYVLVNETLVNADSNYVVANTVGTVDTYGFTDLTTVPLNIDTVTTVMYAKKDDATTRGVTSQLISNSVSSNGSNSYLSGNSYIRYDNIFATNPDGSVAWNPNSVNNLTGGPKLTV